VAFLLESNTRGANRHLQWNIDIDPITKDAKEIEHHQRHAA
jgi:hypothetical protein